MATRHSPHGSLQFFFEPQQQNVQPNRLAKTKRLIHLKGGEALHKGRHTLGVCVVARHLHHAHQRDQTGARSSGVIVHKRPQEARGFLGLPREARSRAPALIPADDEAHVTR